MQFSARTKRQHSKTNAAGCNNNTGMCMFAAAALLARCGTVRATACFGKAKAQTKAQRQHSNNKCSGLPTTTHARACLQLLYCLLAVCDASCFCVLDSAFIMCSKFLAAQFLEANSLRCANQRCLRGPQIPQAATERPKPAARGLSAQNFARCAKRRMQLHLSARTKHTANRQQTTMQLQQRNNSQHNNKQRGTTQPRAAPRHVILIVCRNELLADNSAANYQPTSSQLAALGYSFCRQLATRSQLGVLLAAK